MKETNVNTIFHASYSGKLIRIRRLLVEIYLIEAIVCYNSSFSPEVYVVFVDRSAVG